MRQIIGSEVGRRLSPGFGSIRLFKPRRRKVPRWLLPLLALVLLGLVIAMMLAR